jgi:creatinine amidohydrolase
VVRLQEVLMENLTWEDISLLIKEGYDKVIVPIGSTEQHGPHLPLCTDSLITLEISKKLATKLGKTLVAPIITIGLSKHHMSFPGTITLKEETLYYLLRDIISSLTQHGFRKFILLSMHGGNYPALVNIANILRREYVNVQIEVFEDFNVLSEAFHESAKEAGIDEGIIGSHAGLIETSVIFYLNQNLVKKDKIRRGFIGDLREARKKLREAGIRSVSEIGVIGDPTLYSVEFGEKAIIKTVEFLYDYFKKKLQ